MKAKTAPARTAARKTKAAALWVGVAAFCVLTVLYGTGWSIAGWSRQQRSNMAAHIHDVLGSHAGVHAIAWHCRQDRALEIAHPVPVAVGALAPGCTVRG